MTKEQAAVDTRDLEYQIGVMQAFKARRQIEFRFRERGDGSWCNDSNPAWDWFKYEYRIKPTATLRPWTADEVPLGALMRFKRNPQDRVLVGWVSVQADRDLWLDEREHSTDGGKTWLPCGVAEEAKP